MFYTMLDAAGVVLRVHYKGMKYDVSFSVVTVLKICKRTVSDGFVKKSADSDSVSDSRRRHYKLIYTGHQTQRLSTGGRQTRRRTHVVPGHV